MCCNAASSGKNVSNVDLNVWCHDKNMSKTDQNV